MVSMYQWFNVLWFRVVSLQSQGGNKDVLHFTGQTPFQKLRSFGEGRELISFLVE